jgi:transcriptional antiterminator RfaH
MPLLPLEPFLSPENLLDLDEVVNRDGVDAARWWVLHTRPRSEKALARKFFDRGVPFFLPLYQRQWRTKGRLHRAFMPLFPGYLFLRGESAQRLAAFETNLVANVLPVADQERLRADLARVHRLIISDAPLTPEQSLQPGTLVEIIKGPLIGLEGRVLRRGKQLKLLVEVQMLQRGVSVEIESWMIQPVSGSKGSSPDRTQATLASAEPR